MAEIIDKAIANKKLKYWKHQLLMDNYQIDLQINCNTDDFVNDEVFGEASYNHTNRIGIIKIGAPNLYNVDLETELNSFDFEETLIHELLHIKFGHLQDVDNESYNTIHVIIEDLARALMAEHLGVVVDVSDTIIDKSI